MPQEVTLEHPAPKLPFQFYLGKQQSKLMGLICLKNQQRGSSFLYRTVMLQIVCEFLRLVFFN